MALGAFAAIGQANIKRLMAYSAIGHVGFALVGLAAGTQAGVARRDRLYGDLSRHDARNFRRDPVDAGRRASVEKISNLAGLAKTDPFHGVLLRDADVFAGRHSAARRFFAKWYVFNAAIQAGLYRSP